MQTVTEKHHDPEAARAQEGEAPLQLAPEGGGPLLQNDYVGVLAGTPCTPEEAARIMRCRFHEFAPAKLANFEHPRDGDAPLEVEDAMRLVMTGYGPCEVVVTHVDPHSMTMRTVKGHMEAGRISFGAYRDEVGRLVLRIRSRGRLNSLPVFGGYVLFGKRLQTKLWVTFIERWAEACGGTVIGKVLVETTRVTESRADLGIREHPTFATRDAA